MDCLCLSIVSVQECTGGLIVPTEIVDVSSKKTSWHVRCNVTFQPMRQISIVRNRSPKSKVFSSCSQCHTIRKKQSNTFSLYQAFEQLFQASCPCTATFELAYSLFTTLFPAGLPEFSGASNTEFGACPRPLYFLLHIECSLSLIFACFLSFKTHPQTTSSESFSHRESNSSSSLSTLSQDSLISFQFISVKL